MGLAIIVVAEILLFSGNEFVGGWFTPIVWTGYILLADAVVYRMGGRSLLTTDRLELLVVIFASISGWWLFEFYNAPRFWRSDLELWWHYHNLEPNPYLRRAGYDWAFATIFPAMFLTAQIFMSGLFSGFQGWKSIRFPRWSLSLSLLLGAVTAILPLVVVSHWFAPLVWLGITLFLDPVNYLRGQPSIIGDLQRGDFRRVTSLLAGGAVCGVLWEFWNYWALAKWTYTVPYFGSYKLFEMPVFGYLGFPPFAAQCWVLYIFLRSLLANHPLQTATIWVESSDAVE